MTTLCSHSLQEEWKLKVYHSHCGHNRRLYVSYPLTSHWLEFSHMATRGCKGFWEI